MPYDTHPLQGMLAIIARRDRYDLRALFYEIDNRRNYGKVYLVGFGPGNPDLMTIRADNIIKNSDIIFYDDLLDSSIFDKYSTLKVYVGKRKGNHHTRQDKINTMLYEAVLDGKIVARVKGGEWRLNPPMTIASRGSPVLISPRSSRTTCLTVVFEKPTASSSASSMPRMRQALKSGVIKPHIVWPMNGFSSGEGL